MNNMNSLQQALLDTIPAHLMQYDEPMSLHTSFRIGGPADIFLSPQSFDELKKCLGAVKKHNFPFFLLGGGTNILVSDRGIRGVVICIAGLAEVKVLGNTLVVEAGAQVNDVCRVAAEHALSGIEFIHGMPGTIGGAVWMNARCYGGSISDVLEKAEVINEKQGIAEVSYEPDQFGYKRSPFQGMAGCIYKVSLKLEPGDEGVIRQKMRENHADRVAKGHFNKPSAGSLFKNNREFGAPTGKILDELGLRGATSGGASIAPFHGNIFINQNNASAKDVLSLIRLAIETARAKRNIHLEPEVRLVGDWLPEELAFL